MEQEIHRIWILVSELSEQLAQNNRVAADIRNQIQNLKVSQVANEHMGSSRCRWLSTGGLKLKQWFILYTGTSEYDCKKFPVKEV